MVGGLTVVFPVIFLFSTVYGAKHCQTDNGRSLLQWNWEVQNHKGDIYFINLCQNLTLPGCPSGTSICKNSSQINYGSTNTTKKIREKKLKSDSMFSITFIGGENKNCGSKNYQSEILFYCDKTLGYPEFVDETKCGLTFKFYTSQACLKRPNVIEIPCLLYNPYDGIKRDLSPLIKQKGGHLVATSQNGVEIWINVCREITPNPKGPTSSCPKKSGSCRVGTTKSIGDITEDTKLQYEKGRITLTYHSPEKSTGCVDKANTSITFICPYNSFKDGGIGPVLVSSPSSCNYEIEWKTDYACPDNSRLTQNCTYSNGDVAFDLAKLEKPIKKESYGVSVGDYVYRIKVCSNGQPCGSDLDGSRTAVCQINKKGLKNKSCGDANHRTIRYADRKLTLIYKNGDTCSNGVKRRTIINFRCDPTVDVGTPTFVDEEHCHYFFDWKTRHVCESRKPGTCSTTILVNKRTVSYDLSVLTKTGTNWIALNSLEEAAGYMYYINVCGAVSTQYEACDGAAVCEVHRGKACSLGVYDSPPTRLPSGNLQLNYTRGECSDRDCRISTIIKFICKPKNLESPPELEWKSWDGCEYVFTWSTAAACPLQVINGKDCVVEDSVTGNWFDLSKLQNGTFTAMDEKNKDNYTIKVCGSLNDPCSEVQGAGVCQQTQAQKYNAGQGNSMLYYYDGELKLTYNHGDKCNHKNKPNRITHISFFCDEKIGIGKPVFEKENYCTYHFLWYTRYACPAKTLECLAKGPDGGEYDLSSLVKTDDNWVVQSRGSTFYINVCRVLHLNNATKGCHGTSAVCMKTAAGEYRNIGKVSDPLSVQARGKLSLRYRTNECNTKISFICSKVELDPTLDSSDPNKCDFSFNWATPAACAVKPKVAPGCAGITSNNGKYGDIRSLTKPGAQVYTVNGPSFKIIFNICKKVTCGSDTSSSACLVTGGKNSSIGRLDESAVEYLDNMIVLSYQGGYYMEGPSWGINAKTVINIICSRNIAMGTPVFRGVEKNVYMIDFQTSAVCRARVVQCSVNGTSSKEKYDLRALDQSTGNWRTADDTRDHLVYFINVCDAYHPGGISPSCSGPVGGCQIDGNNNKAHSMGLVQGRPFLSSSGDVTLRYSGGEQCHGQFYRSTRLNFFCSKVHGSPVFITETDECEYVFNWKTPSACPLKLYSGTNCQVYDDQHGILYDLRDLASQPKIVSLKNGTTFNVTFCGNDVKCGSDSVSACLKTGGKPKSYSSGNITYYNEEVQIKYTNGTTQIVNKFYCGSEQLSSGSLVSKNSTYIELEWSSKAACRPVIGEECSLTYNDTLYDLSMLAKEKSNWRARVALEGTKYSKNQFYLSVCRPLVTDVALKKLQTKDSRGAMVDSSGVVHSLGKMDKSLTMSNGFLTMNYGCGSRSNCNNTRIQFVCDSVPEGLGGDPVLDGYDENKKIFHFTWITKAACPVKSRVTLNPTKNCTAIHPATMKIIDLRKLYNKNGYVLKDQKGENYTLSVCGALKLEGWPNSTGMCKKVNAEYVSVGALNQNLHYRQGFLYLLYKNGDGCYGLPGRKMETLISFICDHTVSGNGQPRLERTSDCTHYVTWRTPLACEAEVECVASKGSKFYDLSPLIKNNGNYEAFHGQYRYLINVCRSLVNDPRCSSEAAVCAIDIVRQNGKFSTLDLGHVGSPPSIYDESGGEGVKLVYIGGKCANESTNTTIKFVCDPNETFGKPIVYSDRKGCPRNITWSTSLVCEPKPYQNPNCTFHDPKKGFCFDLTKLGVHNVKIPYGTVTFNICGIQNLGNCHNSDVCISLAKDKKSHTIPIPKKQRNIQYAGREVHVTYDRVSIVIYCGDDRNSPGPQYVGQSKKGKNTKYLFNWVSPLVCPPRQLSCVLGDGEDEYDLGVLTRQTNSWEVKHNEDTYWVNICGNVPYKLTSICSSRITALRKKKNGDVQVIGKDTEQKLYVKRSGKFPIGLNYSSDEPNKDCSKNKPSAVIHKFECCNFNHPPYLESFDSKECLFVFVWRTQAACPKGRTHSCSKSKFSIGGKSAAVIGTFTAIGILAAIIFFVWKPEKRESAALWIRWHVRKYICCKPSYQASYRYKKVNTEDVDGETDFIIEANAETVFSDDEQDDNGDNDKDDDDLLPLDDDLLNLED